MKEDRNRIRISVRDLVEFLLRTGSLDTGAGRVSESAMLEGARIHRALQKKEGPGYRAEVLLRMDIPVSLSDTGAVLCLEGRADGIYAAGTDREDPAGKSGPVEEAPEAARIMEETGSGETTAEAAQAAPDKAEILSEELEAAQAAPEKKGILPEEPEVPEAAPEKEEAAVLWTIDEIKTLLGGLDSLREPNEVHLAQARCYAWMYAGMQGLERIQIRMTYCSQVTGEVRRFYETMDFAALDRWFSDLIESYKPWIRLRLSFGRMRQETLEKLVFPFPYREGQFELAAGVYRTIVHGKKLFLQAPTGTGKTMAVLFPALKAVGAGKAERVFYLTAKAVTGRAAVEALDILRDRGLRIRSLVLASKERTCPCETVDCRPEVCPRADGHFDRVNDALRSLLEEAAEGRPMTQQQIAACAERHSVCPYELAMDASDFADVIICDYNYVFHPRARLTRLLGDRQKPAAGQAVLLVDEAHNLLERGREIYSADLSLQEVRQFRRSVRETRPGLWKKLRGLVQALNALDRGAEEVSSLRSAGAAGNEKVQIFSSWTKADGAEADRTKADGSKIDGTEANGAEAEGVKAEETEANGTKTGGTEADRTRADGTQSDGTRADGTKTDGAGGRRDLLRAVEEAEGAIQWILEQESKSAALYGPQGADPAAGQELLDFYFRLSHFEAVLRDLDGHYLACAVRGGRSRPEAGPGEGAPDQDGDGRKKGSRRSFSIHLLCADPSGRLQACLSGMAGAVFFSATFLPIQYYKKLLGGTDSDFEMYARSSFPPDRRHVVIVRDVTSRYRDRNEENYARIAQTIGRIVTCRPGNYMAFFPSYAFLDHVRDAFCRICETGTGSCPVSILAQRREMSDADRLSFLEAFDTPRDDRCLVGFCVLGGMFGEGIDLRSDRLIGSLIVGTGIPPVETERELLRDYFSGQGMNGYDYAYRFPGMNKVLQAAGRVIRTSEDTGIVTLLDSRFGEASNRGLFPVEWGQPEALDGGRAADSIRAFWKRFDTGKKRSRSPEAF